MSKHLLSYLSTLKATQLKHLGLLTGAPTNGTKPELIARLNASLPQTILAHPSEKIVSIDLGIRNLGIFVASLTLPALPTPSPSLSPKSTSPSSTRPQLHIHHWSRITLLSTQLSSSSQASNKDHSIPTLFTPPHLAPLAHGLVTRTLLPHQPSTLLIERQRHRSAGGAAVQEWTVRVNTLEAMVWAVLETLKQQQQRGVEPGDEGQSVAGGGVSTPACWAVEPGRVARFWLDGDDGLGSAQIGEWEEQVMGTGSGVRGREEKRGRESTRVRRRAADVKKEKIALVRSWLEPGVRSPFELSFADDVENLRGVLAKPLKRNGARKLGRHSSAELKDDTKAGKFDDLADCFLQAATWIQWEWNRRRIVHAIKSKKDG